MSKLEKTEIDDAKSSDLVTVIENFGVQLTKAGPEYKAICPFHQETSPSFTVTPSANRYFCFGCGANGDAIQFVQDYAGLSFVDAVNQLNGKSSSDTEIKPRAPRVIAREKVSEWVPFAVVPDSAPIPMSKINKKINDKWVSLEPARVWKYLNAKSELIGYIYRFNLPTGGKEVVPQTYCTNTDTGEIAWRWMSFDKPRPIYGLELLAQNPQAQVIIVEGEKDCDAAREHFLARKIPTSKLVVVAWPGGGKAIKHVDWSPLKGRKICLWPDADQKTYLDNHKLAGQLIPFDEQVGTVSMGELFHQTKDICESVKFVAPPHGVPDGWGLGDELPAGFDIVAHMKTAILAAEQFVMALPDESEPESSEPPPWEGEASFEPPAIVEDVPVVEAPKVPHEKIVVSNARKRKYPKIERPNTDEERDRSNNPYFRVLGYDHDKYFIYSIEKSQIMVLTKSDLSESGFLDLAELNWWETNFSALVGTKKFEKKIAVNWFARKAASMGIYDTTRIRGRGAWEDKGRHVFHHGDFLTVDSETMDVTDIESHYVYEKSRSLPEIAKEALSDEDGQNILNMASLFRWAKPASAALLTGWIALAPICGALKWRSHIWINGGAGSGKSTILTDFTHYLLNGMDLFAQGNSSEAGIRQRLKGDAIPVLFDESESSTERDSMRIQSILSLIRQSSSESPAEVLKGTAGGESMSFHIRSMFCLASIQVGIKQQADIERVTVLSLLPKADVKNSSEVWKQISEQLHLLRKDETVAGRLVRRSLNLLPITLKNIHTFSEAAAIRFGSQRDGDQYGTLLAGAWSVISSEIVTIDQAMGLIDSYDWSEHREQNDMQEGERALATLMGALIRVGSVEVSVHEIIRCAQDMESEGLTLGRPAAEALLQRHGMRVDGKMLLLSNTSDQLRALVAGTPFEADLRGALLRFKGAARYDKAIKFNGVTTRAITIPLSSITSDDIITEAGEVQF